MSSNPSSLLKPLGPAVAGDGPIMVEVFVSGRPTHADAEIPGVYALSVDPTLGQERWADAAVGALCREAAISRPGDFIFSVVSEETTLRPSTIDPTGDVAKRATYLFKLCD